jgi:hypothetical protein
MIDECLLFKKFLKLNFEVAKLINIVIRDPRIGILIQMNRKFYEIKSSHS